MADMLTLQGWKNMETAPRSARDVELRLPTGDVEVGFWRDRSGWVMEDGYNLTDGDLTGWRDLTAKEQINE